ncbi:uncharacterized protein LOC131848827 [Achroia grisella]|uniref:uncharacterized protein LOC131848827 n=1 Tax=Achroia grisella TaxID=688607 RepID=UPI0027D2FD51|nr:uncharacterized protein LOC131848827 [Achroia grisella]
MNSWKPLVTAAVIPTPMYSLPLCSVPVIVDLQVINTSVYTYTNPATGLSPLLAETLFSKAPVSNYAYNEPIIYSEDQVLLTNYINKSNTVVYENSDADESMNNTITSKNIYILDPLEAYLSLPRELFPPANMILIDPNPVIDEFCKVDNIVNHAPWLLDLEFGIPKAPITRPLPVYNVKFSSINCKNAPDAIHPGFESCSPEFRKVLLFYYDCIVSVWYRGYIQMNYDKSVENFQSWLLLPMQLLGMCWPYILHT